MPVLLDDNNRKPIARLRFNSKSQKYIGLLDEDKNESRIPIASLDDLYQHSDQIIAAVHRYA